MALLCPGKLTFHVLFEIAFAGCRHPKQGTQTTAMARDAVPFLTGLQITIAVSLSFVVNRRFHKLAPFVRLFDLRERNGDVTPTIRSHHSLTAFLYDVGNSGYVETANI